MAVPTPSTWHGPVEQPSAQIQKPMQSWHPAKLLSSSSSSDAGQSVYSDTDHDPHAEQAMEPNTDYAQNRDTAGRGLQPQEPPAFPPETVDRPGSPADNQMNADRAGLLPARVYRGIPHGSDPLALRSFDLDTVEELLPIEERTLRSPRPGLSASVDDSQESLRPCDIKQSVDTSQQEGHSPSHRIPDVSSPVPDVGSPAACNSPVRNSITRTRKERFEAHDRSKVASLETAVPVQASASPPSLFPDGNGDKQNLGGISSAASSPAQTVLTSMDRTRDTAHSPNSSFAGLVC